MVFHMSCDTTQHRALETTHCVGWLLNCKQTSRGRESSHEGSHKLRCTSRREPSHLRRPPSLALADNGTDSRSQRTNATTGGAPSIRQTLPPSAAPTGTLGSPVFLMTGLYLPRPRSSTRSFEMNRGPNASYFARRERPQTNAAAVADGNDQGCNRKGRPEQ